MKTQPVVARLSSGFRTEIEAGTHRWVLDQPVEAGGTDEGPTPYDALAASLAGCTAMTLEFFAKREKIPLEGIEVRVTHDRQYAKDCADCLDKSGFIHEFTVEVLPRGPLTDEQKETLLKIAKRCPVAKTLGSQIRIRESLG